LSKHFALQTIWKSVSRDEKMRQATELFPNKKESGRVSEREGILPRKRAYSQELLRSENQCLSTLTFLLRGGLNMQ
jgi:hypothetical protein